MDKFLRGVQVQSYCPACAASLRADGAVLDTEAARQAWLEGV